MENDKKDVGAIHDIIFTLQHLVALEHHAIESYSQSKDETQIELSMKARHIRSKIMYQIVKESKNQIYCESKHLLGASQGLKEMGNRYLEQGEEKLAKECFEDSADLEAIFIILNS